MMEGWIWIWRRHAKLLYRPLAVLILTGHLGLWDGMGARPRYLLTSPLSPEMVRTVSQITQEATEAGTVPMQPTP